MALITAGGFTVFRGSITLPQIGAWTADLDLDASADIKGAIEIEMPEAAKLVGTVTSGALHHGYMRARIVAGKAGLSKPATPKFYESPKLRSVLADLAKTAGETISNTIASGVLNAPMLGWTTIEMPVGVQIAALVGSAAPGASWRMLPDGTIWIGTETWKKSSVRDYRILDRRSSEGRIEIGLDTPALIPGTALGDDHIGDIEYQIDNEGVRTTAWLA